MAQLTSTDSGAVMHSAPDPREFLQAAVSSAGSFEAVRSALAQLETEAELLTLRSEVERLRSELAARDAVQVCAPDDLGPPLDLDALEYDPLDSCALDVLDFEDVPRVSAEDLQAAVTVQALGYGYVDSMALAERLSPAGDLDSLARRINCLCEVWDFENDGDYQWNVDEPAALLDQVERVSLHKPRWRGGWYASALEAVKCGGVFYLPNDAPEKWRARMARRAAYALNQDYGRVDPGQRGAVQRQINALDRIGRGRGGALYG